MILKAICYGIWWIIKTPFVILFWIFNLLKRDGPLISIWFWIIGGFYLYHINKIDTWYLFIGIYCTIQYLSYISDKKEEKLKADIERLNKKIEILTYGR